MGYVQPHGSYKLERNTINGKAIYSCADGQKGVVYIGGDKRINVTDPEVEAQIAK